MDENYDLYRVVEYSAALQFVQALDSRTDFVYKGILKYFMTVAEWTDKYSANKTLPTADTLVRDLSIERERIDLFIQELCFKSNPPIIKKITVIEYNPTSVSKAPQLSQLINKSTVFARPSTVDGSSVNRYVNGCNETSIANIKRIIKDNRILWKGESFREFIFSKITTNKLSETYASADVGNLFNCFYDTKKEFKEASINIHLKPILKKLVDDKLLLFFRNDKANKPGNKSIFLYNNNDEIIERIEIYIAFLKKNILPVLQKIGVIEEFKEEDFNDISPITKQVLALMDESYGDQKTIIEELEILNEFYKKYKEEQVQNELKDQLNSIIQQIENSGKIVDFASIKLNGKELPEKMVSMILNHKELVYTEYTDSRDTYFQFLLHKKCIKGAIELAKKSYQVTTNDTELRILSKMNVFDLLDNDQKKDFSNAENLSLFKYLPMFTRLWRLILGNIFVTKEEAEIIKRQKEEEQKKRLIKAKEKIFEKQKQKIVEERMKEKEKPAVPQEETGASMNLENDKEVKEFLHEILRTLDSAWDQRVLPNREYLLTELVKNKFKVTEEELIAFIKKYSQKDILSFQIKTKLPKYKWPILISRAYLKRNGAKLLAWASKEYDEQKKAPMPIQEKYDIFTSLEDFLETTLPKLK